ncbi:enoyl-CoA hydratase/isomerase family protein [Rhodococcus globerulus]|uniref:Enoyl-CoA hydratase/isomerase family protein n=1 Tax=Rhodococcus globerulus TaxID=33008 RepID=A0ABU4C3W6_RHOGO|nr:enoyl-CoA hydratase/isomerase family protein [Rhodococcus globerulus]MDV6271172.1 enoyl-CoA hydratase/isomerase family protein [Rhodococcus globerulus]
MTPHPGFIQVERDGDVATITLRREDKQNALSAHLETALLRTLSTRAVTSSRVIILTGGDKVFSAGADITELPAMTPDAIDQYYRRSGSVYEAVATLPQPTISAIAGYCLGGGLELALATDIRVADPTAVFGFPETSHGILPSSGGISRSIRMIGMGRARDLVLRGHRIDAKKAENWGLITETTEMADQLNQAMVIAQSLAMTAPFALNITKRVLDANADASHRSGLFIEQLAYSLLNNSSTT